MPNEPITGLPLPEQKWNFAHMAANSILEVIDAYTGLWAESFVRVLPDNLVASQVGDDGFVDLSTDEGKIYVVESGVPTLHDDGITVLGGKICVWKNNGWTAITPKEGLTAYFSDDDSRAFFNGGRWIKPDGISDPALDWTGVSTSLNEINNMFRGLGYISGGSTEPAIVMIDVLDGEAQEN